MDTMDLKDKVAVVTGGANGIGLSITKGLLENGVSVAILDRNKEKGEASKKLLQEKYENEKVDFFRCDVTEKEEFQCAVKEAVDKFSRLDIFVNNAGIGPHAQWEHILEVNLIGLIRGAEEATKYMSKESGGKGGVIVNIASIAGLMPYAVGPHYAASKYGVIGFTRSSAMPDKYEASGVRHVAVCPGYTESDLNDGIKEQRTQYIERMMKIKIIWQYPEVVANCVVEVVKNADTGSVWVVENNEPAYEICIPNYTAVKPKSGSNELSSHA